jgi:hypothetical protein
LRDAVAEHLDLDVPAGRHKPLEVHPRVAESSGGLRGGEIQRVRQLRGGLHQLHSTATPAADGLDQQRIADLARDLSCTGQVRGLSARHHRHSRGHRVRRCAQLVPDRLQRLRGGADEDDAGRRASPRQQRVFGKEAVSGVHRVSGKIRRVELRHRAADEHGPADEHPIADEDKAAVARPEGAS